MQENTTEPRLQRALNLRDLVLLNIAKSRASVWVVAALGFGITLFSTLISVVPTREVENKGLFVAKVVGGAALLIAAGLIVYYARRGKAAPLLRP